MPDGADIISTTDPYGSVLNAMYATLGLGLSTETTTASSIALRARAAVDAVFASALSVVSGLTTLPHYDRIMQTGAFSLYSALENQIKANLPSGWNMGTSAGYIHTLDSWMQRINGVSTSAVASGAAISSVTATTINGGQIPQVTSAYCPLIQYSWVGAYDFIESLPSASTVGIAIGGTANAITIVIPGPVPTGVTKIRVYRTLVGTTTPYCWAQDTTVTVGQTNISVVLSNGDQTLRQNINPANWLAYMWRPETAYLYALAWSTSPVIGASSSSILPLVPSSIGMATQQTVLLNPITNFLGVGNNINPVGNSFGTFSVGGAYASNTYPLGTNNNTTYTQGFSGATAIRARATIGLNGTLAPVITYTYFDATHPMSGSAQTQTGISPTSNFAGTGTGETVSFTIPAGRIVTSITQTSTTGTATAGTIIYEASNPRAYF